MALFVTETLGWRFLLALTLSVTLWGRLTLAQNPQKSDVYPTEIAVEPRNLPENLVVANDLPPVKLRIAAPQERWKDVTPASFRAVVDLAGTAPGLFQRDVQVEVADPDVRLLERIPSQVTVRLEELRTASLPVRVNQVGSVPFGYRVAGEPVVVPSTVEVSGASSAVEKVTETVVAVRLEEARASIDRSIRPEPRGPGGVVAGVRLQPQFVSVTIPVEQIAGTKAVPLVPQIKGQPATGYWLGGISVDPAAVQIVGDPRALGPVTLLNTVEVDVAGAEAEVVRIVAIQRPAGVNLVRDQQATVRVAIQPLPSQQVRDVAVSVDNLADGLAASVSPNVVSVTLSGPQPALLRLAPPDVVAAVDGAGLAPGAHSLPVAVRAPEGLRVERVAPDRVGVTVAAR